MEADASDDDLIQEMLPAFVEEAQEQSDTLEQLLLELESAPDDQELLNALFRCAHTIKGSAGVFGLDDVVSFTHHVEALLQRMRDGLVQLDPTLNTLLLRSNDMIRRLVNGARGNQPLDDEQTQRRNDLIEQLKTATAGAGAEPSVVTDAPAGTPNVEGTASGCQSWKISVHFGIDTFRHGIDPLTLLNYVRGLGEITDIEGLTDDIPSLSALDPEACHWGFDFTLSTDGSRDQIEQAFKFAMDDCTLTIRPDAVAITDVVDRIEALPDPLALGEILVSAGAITRAQLVQGLDRQTQEQHETPDRSAPLLGEVLQTQAALSPKVVSAALQKQQRQRSGGSIDESAYIRVQAERLDEVINLLGELVIAGAGAAVVARQSRQRHLVEANQQVMRLIESIRNSTLKLRMVPIGDTFARFKRVVRDTASELGKDVSLEIVGGDTELDKAMVERIADPLMHLVRNALDHGLETPEQRQAAGKPAQGRLTLSACHESGSVLIRITDDGRGIQRDKVLQRAWERGLIEPGVTPADDDILNLIFAPGFSTADAVTNLSGRGVGMDVVRSNVESLRGTVMVSSKPGEGSSMEIRLPLTLAIIDGFLVGVGSSKFILPLESVVEVIANRSVATTVDARGRCCVDLRGELLPVVNLRSLYALDGDEPERSSVVVVRSGPRRIGVIVDVLLGQHQTVIKPLGAMLRSLRGMSGSSILGTGEVALIFDTAGLSQLAMQPREGPARQAAPPRTQPQCQQRHERETS